MGLSRWWEGWKRALRGGVHDMHLLWEHNCQEEDWWFLRIDVRNTFNEEKRTAMVWTVRHEWPSDAQFTFNCYRHWDTLVVQDSEDVTGHFLHIKEGVTQGDPLAKIAYGNGVLPLIRELLGAHPHVTQPLYAYDVRAGGTFEQILTPFQDM